MFSNTFGSRSYFSLLTTFGNCPVEDRKNTGFAHRLLRRKTRTNWLAGKLNNGFSMLTWLGLGKFNTRSLPFMVSLRTVFRALLICTCISLPGKSSRIRYPPKCVWKMFVYIWQKAAGEGGGRTCGNRAPIGCCLLLGPWNMTSAIEVEMQLHLA